MITLTYVGWFIGMVAILEMNGDDPNPVALPAIEVVIDDTK